MRVIAGSARRLQLKTVKNMDTRPTTDRIKETLFNMIQDDIPSSRFLDLFSGSGAIGIEALSRGADHAVFVENNKAAAACIRDNLAFTRLADQAVVMESNAITAISMLESKKEFFDIIFMDPPYEKELEKEVLERLVHSPILDENTLIIVEASLDTDFSYLKEMGYLVIRDKIYKTNQHMFMRKA
ncbi:MAG: 16S rRNA (guanine(966)-N(2))-methyltransferase RsmD [Lachnospiraceae bacterium]|nr:16S rRNA (guanine(966)-N(2))-methyltransferase RsmD [Lachnospiraceae bacterium]